MVNPSRKGAKAIESFRKGKGEEAKAGVEEMAHVYASTIRKETAIAAMEAIASSNTLVLLEGEAEEKGAGAKVMSRRSLLL